VEEMVTAAIRFEEILGNERFVQREYLVNSTSFNIISVL
jgi:hypothetical protein